MEQAAALGSRVLQQLFVSTNLEQEKTLDRFLRSISYADEKFALFVGSMADYVGRLSKLLLTCS